MDDVRQLAAGGELTGGDGASARRRARSPTTARVPIAPRVSDWSSVRKLS